MADRTYSSAFNQNKAQPAFNYVWDAAATYTASDGTPVTGAWVPSTPAAGGGGSADFTATNIILRSGVNNNAAASQSSSVNFTGSFGVSAAREFHSVFGYCSGNAQYLRMFDGTGSNGTFLGVIAISQQNNFSVDFSAHGAKVTAGIFVAFSSSPSSQVATGPDGIITIIWK